MPEKIPGLYHYITTRKESKGGFLFNPFLMSETFLNTREYRVLELCNGRNTLSGIVTAIAAETGMDDSSAHSFVARCLNHFNNQYSLTWSDNKKEGGRPKPEDSAPDLPADYYSAPLSVIFEITHRCNLKCRHCLVNAGNALAGELLPEEIKGIMDQLKEMKVFSINFGGGEPLLRSDFVDILKYASDLNFGIIISTNGYLVNDQFLDQLEDLKAFTVQVSVDGLEGTHDRFRGVQGSFKKALNALELFAGRGYNTTMSTMILRDNLGEMKELCELASGLGLSSLKLSSFMPAGRGNENAPFHKLTKSELKDFARQMAMLKEEFDGRLYIDDKPTYPFLLSDNGKPERDPRNGSRIGCSAGQTNLVISPDGTVYACPFLTDMPAGNLREQTLKDIWTGSGILHLFRNLDSTQLKGKCRTCKHLPGECQGGCRAAAWLATGDFFGEDPFCWYGN